MPPFKIVVGLLISTLLIGCQLNPTMPAQTSDQPPASNQNQLAYIGGDGNVYVITASRESTIAITADATTFAEGNGYSYHRIAWSPDGHYLVYADRDDKRIERVWIINTQSQNSNEPQLISEGSIGIWAWN